MSVYCFFLCFFSNIPLIARDITVMIRAKRAIKTTCGILFSVFVSFISPRSDNFVCLMIFSDRISSRLSPKTWSPFPFIITSRLYFWHKIFYALQRYDVLFFFQASLPINHPHLNQKVRALLLDSKQLLWNKVCGETVFCLQ